MTTYDPATALLVVDVQNDFADPGGSLYVRGGEDVVPVVNDEIAKALSGGALLVYSQDWHPEHTPHFEQDGGVWPVHCVRDTWGSAFFPKLRVEPDAPVVRKGTGGEDGYSVFTVRDPQSGETAPTALERVLRERGIERLVVCGLATDYCVVETVRDARARDLAVEVVTAAIRAVDRNPGDGERALERMRAAGATLV